MPEEGRDREEIAHALAELELDRYFAALPAADKAARLGEALAFAEGLADQTAAKFGRPADATDLYALAGRLSVKVVGVPGRNPYSSVLAEYSQRPARIRLYDEKILETEEKLRAIGPEFFPRFGLRELCLCHELFHHLEKSALGDTGRIVRLEVAWLGWFRRMHAVARASEVASHAFVRRLLELPYSPIVFKSLLAAGAGVSQAARQSSA